jgi:hypothetical protein
MLELGLQQSLVPRLSNQAVSELNSLRSALNSVTLTEAMDRRISNFCKGDTNWTAALSTECSRLGEMQWMLKPLSSGTKDLSKGLSSIFSQSLICIFF